MTSPSRSRRPGTGAASLLAASLLVGSIAPSLAASTWPHDQDLSDGQARVTTSFHRHFWRGSQLAKAPARDTEMVALADEAETTHAYCLDRFRSYDPATGTYLGYDGEEHPCP